MLTLGPLAFATPWILLALASLPLIWWLLRVTPPAPKRIKFPAIQLLMGLDAHEESPSKMPLWLLLVRLCLAALLILALATPLWRPAPNTHAESGFLIVIDNDWSAAAHWDSLTREAQALIEQAKRTNQPIALLTTTGPNAQRPAELQTADDALAKLRALAPFALPANRATTALALETPVAGISALSPVWISNGLEDWQAESLSAALVDTTGKDITLIRPTPAQTPVLILPPTAGSEGLEITVRRVEESTAATTHVLRARAENGASLATLNIPFNAGEIEHTVSLALPLELRNRLSRLDIEGMHTAGSTFLLDQRWKRRTVGIITASREKEGQPLLSDVYYLERALQPFAEILHPQAAPSTTAPDATRADAQSETIGLLKQNLSVLILSDIGQLSQGDAEAITQWVKAGGFLVRFAGPRLATSSDALMPVSLRNGNRSLEGALSWTTPQTLSPFDEKSPFYGLTLGGDVSINRQVLADPNSLQNATTWAALNDGTPLVTGRTLGAGSLVLFHVTANTEWSNLPLSGLFVDMLSRIVDLSEGVPPSMGSEQLATLNPKSILTGTAQLIAPPPWVEALQITPDTTLIPDAQHPAGLYGDGGLGRALNIGALDIDLVAQQNRPSFGLVKGLEPQAEQRLKAPLLVAAFILFLIDCVAALYLSGKLSGAPLPQKGRVKSTMALVVLAASLMIMAPAHLHAQENTDEPVSSKTLEAALKTRLAYVLTGDTQTDDVSKLGLEALSEKLHDRTAISPGKPIAIDIETDELSIYPFLYWPVLSDQQPLSDATAARVDAYMKRGGMILFDTKAQGDARARADGRSDALVGLLEKLDIPALTPVSDGHVLTRSFYLMQTFPGRWDNGPLWVEVARNTSIGQGSSNDGVTAILIGDNDYAGAWAQDGAGRPLFPVVPGGERQREWAYRFGVNLVIYSMTGNYKADQVHVPALLERLGQ
ncbi:MAG: hypothetical protein ACJAVO_001534 [Parvibaculaceae bacterium]|jgi:hypothetical protein